MAIGLTIKTAFDGLGIQKLKKELENINLKAKQVTNSLRASIWSSFLPKD